MDPRSRLDVQPAFGQSTLTASKVEKLLGAKERQVADDSGAAAIRTLDKDRLTKVGKGGREPSAESDKPAPPLRTKLLTLQAVNRSEFHLKPPSEGGGTIQSPSETPQPNPAIG